MHVYDIFFSDDIDRILTPHNNVSQKTYMCKVSPRLALQTLRHIATIIISRKMTYIHRSCLIGTGGPKGDLVGFKAAFNCTSVILLRQGVNHIGELNENGYAADNPSII